MQKLRLKKCIVIALFLLLVTFIVIGLYNPLSVSEITINSDKVKKPIRIALVSDLHSCKYGKAQSKLIDAIVRQNPDIICLTGDIFDDKFSDENTEQFIAGISAKFPCYFVTGNHELCLKKAELNKKMAILDKYGVHRLINENKKVYVNGQIINMMGADDSLIETLDLTFTENIDREYYSILLSHRPEYFDDYAKTGVDLVLCGHAHGGQWRIPGILENGLFAPNQGLFPKYTSGLFTKGNTNMIVSRGLAKESTGIPRFYNRPEVVIVVIQ